VSYGGIVLKFRTPCQVAILPSPPEITADFIDRFHGDITVIDPTKLVLIQSKHCID
jgi:hypothetical protein